MVAITFRTEDVTKWGTGAGAPLSASQVDVNFWNLKQAVELLESEMPDAVNGIDTFSVVGNQFYILMTDGSQQGPYDLPLIQWTPRGSWQIYTTYNANDLVSYEASLYLVLRSHTSSSGGFDPSANDGAGNNYYSLVFDVATFALPTGGATGQILAKNSATDYDVSWIDPPTGGGGTGSLDVAINYLSLNLVPGGDLGSDPVYSTPAWTYNDWSWSVGNLYILYAGTGNPNITIPLEGLTIGEWYLIEIDGEFWGDALYMHFQQAYQKAYAVGKTSFLFKARTETDNFYLSPFYYASYFEGTIYSISLRNVEATGPVTITDGVDPVLTLGYDKRNIFMGGTNARYSQDYGGYYGGSFYGNIGIGNGALANIGPTGVGNIAIGEMALANASNQYNIGIGFAALLQSYGYSNVAIGHEALANNSDGNNNIAIGYQSMKASTTGYYNIALGEEALALLTTSKQNVAIGYEAGGGTSTAMDDCVFIGHKSGYNYYYRVGSKNTFIGSQITVYQHDLTNMIAIGYGATPNESNTAFIGDSNVKKIRIGSNRYVGEPKHALVSGASAGSTFTISGINGADRLDEVIYHPGSSYVIQDLTAEFQIYGPGGSIVQTGSTNTTGGKLLVRWTALT